MLKAKWICSLPKEGKASVATAPHFLTLRGPITVCPKRMSDFARQVEVLRPQLLRFARAQLRNDAWAEDAVSVFGDRFGIVLDYSPESLRKMDDAISTSFEKGEEPLPTTALPLGAYVGEVVRVNLGGDWHIAESVLESSIVISGPGGGQELYPFRRVVKRFVEGTSASLEVWYEAAVRSSRN